MTERSEVRADFDEVASRWRREFEDRDNEAEERKDLASRWQQYAQKKLSSLQRLLQRSTARDASDASTELAT